jgi:hypothetical protein
MPKEYLEYREVDDYRIAIDTVYAACGMILFSFAKYDCKTKDIIIRNFIARTAIALKGILALWDISDYQDAWVIHRALLDRMFHLRSIGENEEFSQYDDWSFYEQYKAQNKVKSDPEFKHEVVGWVYELTDAQKKKANFLSKNKPVWKRPKAEAIAKDMGMLFLYHYGYDYASTHVHPMANDGQQDFYTITKIDPAVPFPSNNTVLSNSILAATMILQDAINFSSFRWRKVVWDLLDELRSSLRSNDDSYIATFMKIAEFFKDGTLCEPIQT